MKRGLFPLLLVGLAATWAAPVSAQTVPAASTREAQRDALHDIVASAARHEGDNDSTEADTARLLKAQTAAIQALAAQIKRLEARVARLEQQR